MAYTALARRYRSGQFDEVVGQEAIARTLRKAIESNRVAHAYLFTGTRGVGKTTTARLFAKALNAPGDKPPEVAKAIMEGRDTDVIEIDAASNRGVEEARELIANAPLIPMRGGFKIYIIDEVHMLTREAFNALLKTMEEPPSHVKFILCTTETHKVPATIQSRCQRFDFRPISARMIADHLTAVVQQEGLKAEPAALATVAREARGSMRDALSLLDRLLASGEATLTLALLEELLGAPDRTLVDGLLDALAASDAAGALTAGDALLAKGVSPDQLLDTLMDRLRDVLVVSTCGEATPLVDMSEEERARAAALARRFDAPSLVHMMALCESVQGRLRYSVGARALVDMLLARLAMTERIADAAALARGGGEPEPKKAPGLPALRPRAAGPERPTQAEHPASAPTRSTQPSAAARDIAGSSTSAPSTAGAAIAPGATAPPAPSDDPSVVWERVRNAATGGPTLVMLDTLRLVAIKGSTAHIEADSPQALSFAIGKVERLTGMVTGAVGRPVRVALALRAGAPTERATGAQSPGGGADPRAVAEATPIVRRAIELFDARVVRVDDDPRTP